MNPSPIHPGTTGDSLAAQSPESRRVIYGPGDSKLGFPKPMPASKRRLRRPATGTILDPKAAGAEFEPVP